MKWTASLTSLKSILGTVAPVIAAAVGGPLAGSAVTAIEGALGLHLEGVPVAKKLDAIATAVANASPADLLALKQADQQFQAKMAELGFADAEALEKLSDDDRASARAREIAVKDWTPRALALGTTGAFWGMLVYIARWPIPAESHDIVVAMVGVLGAGWMGVMTYFFGSSAGSARKTELLSDQAGK